MLRTNVSIYLSESVSVYLSAIEERRLKVDTAFCYSCINHFVKMFRRLFEEYGFGPEYPEIKS